MTTGPLFKKIVIYALPIAASGLLQLCFNAADLVVLGQYCGNASVAAVGSTNVMIGLLVNFFIGFSVGSGVTAAQAIGAEDDEKIERIVHTSIPTAVLFGLVLTVVGFLFSDGLLRLMETPGDVIDLATVYMRTYFCGTIGSLIFNFGASILRAAGDTRRPLIYLTISGALNVVLNVFFVLVFDMDVQGVALATAITQWLSGVLVLIAMMRRTDACRLRLGKLRLDFSAFKSIVGIGLPAGIQSSMFCISNVIVQSSVNSFGSVVMAGCSAAGSLEGFAWIPMNSICQAAMYFTGQNFGARKFDRIRDIRRVTLITVFFTGLILGTIVNIFAPQLLSLYVPESPESIRYGISRLRFVCMGYCVCGLQDIMTAIIRGMGYSLAPMLISVFGICVVRIVWIFTGFRLPQFHNIGALYFSYPLSWVVTFVLQSVCYAILFKKVREKSEHSLR